ncbi:MAG: riboflavin synthase [Bacteroidales bacterium]|nr:riboflavin synthase [Bacteroidales bacterium]
MFTGIVEETGCIMSVSRSGGYAGFEIAANLILQDVKNGDSINTNGVCLTVTSFSKKSFSVDTVAETLRRTNLGHLKPGDRVNLERAMPANGRFGGHIVNGHIDGTGMISKIRTEGNSKIISIEADQSLMKYIVEKGSVALDGISLTVMSAASGTFSVSVIPFTGSETTLLAKSAGDTVNIECDILAKYIEQLIKQGKEDKRGSNLNMGFLSEHGFIE